MKNTFSIGEIFSRSFELTKKHWRFLVGATFFYYVAYLVVVKAGHGPTAFILSIAGMVISILFTIGMYRIAFKIESGGEPKWEDFKTDFDTFLSLFLVSILTAIIVGVGFILLVIPGIIAAIRLSMGYLVVLDKNITGFDALKESWRMTRGYGWKLFWFSLCIGAIMILAIIPLGLGLLFAVPFSTIAFVILYKILTKQSETVIEPIKQDAPSVEEKLPKVQGE